MFSVHTHRLKNSIKLKIAVIETMTAKRKISMHTPGINVHLPGSMEMIVKLAKTFLSCKGWQIADSSCPTTLITPTSNRLWFQNLKFVL